MKILIHSDEYYPTAQACAYRMQILADAFVKQGNEVTVIASSANLDGKNFAKRDEKVLYAAAIKMTKKTAIMRLFNNLSFAINSIFMAVKIGKIDVVITTSPPPLISFSGWLIAKMKGAKLVYDVRDIWPDVAVEMGSFSRDSLYYKVFKFIARFMYKNADWITTVSPGKVSKITKHLNEIDSNIDKKKIKTEFIDDKTLKIKSTEKGNTIIVKQLGRNDGLLSQSNTMDLSDDQLAKK